MRVDLAGKRLQPRLHQQVLLLLQFDFVTGVVPDLKGKGNRKERSHIQREVRQAVGAVPGGIEQENRRWKDVSQKLAKELGEQNREGKGEREYLEVLQRAPEVEVDKRR